MTTNEKKRADLGFGDALEDISTEEWPLEKSENKSADLDKETVKEVAEKTGFQSREAFKPTRTRKKKLVARMQKNFRPSMDNCEKFEFLAGSKLTNKDGPELIDEALELIFKKYNKEMAFYEEMKQRKFS